MRTQGKVQDLLYGRFVDRLVEVGAYGEIEALREFWQSQAAANAAAAAQASVIVPPPPIQEKEAEA
jgi:hypothetical protein